MLLPCCDGGGIDPWQSRALALGGHYYYYASGGEVGLLLLFTFFPPKTFFDDAVLVQLTSLDQTLGSGLVGVEGVDSWC